MKFLLIFITIIFSFANTKIAVAGNLAKPIKEINKKYDLNLTIFVSSSGELMNDILWQPKKYDIFISANKKFTDELTRYKACVKNDILTYGKAILISKNLKINSINDLLKAKKIVIANPHYAPFGKIAKEILNNSHLFEKLKNKLVIVDNILDVNKQVLTHKDWIGISSNSAKTLKVNYYPIPLKYYQPLPQTICLINPKKENIYNFLISEKVKKVLKKYGYLNEYKNNK